MKRKFNQRKRPEENIASEWDDMEDGYFSEDGEPLGSAGEDEADIYYSDEETEYEDLYDSEEDEAYYADEESGEDEAYYADEESGEDEAYYADEESGEDGAYYADEESEEDGAYYADEESGEDEAYYADEESGEDEAYYADEESEEDEAYYADEESEEDETYYAGEEPVNDEGYYAGGGGEDEAYYADDESDEEAYYADEEYEDGEAYDAKEKKRSANGRRKNGSPFAKLWNGFLDMGVMDRIIACTGVGVLILALTTGGVFLSARMLDKQVSGFADVGRQLEGINLIGENGLLAVADAQLGKIAAANAVAGNEEPETKDYEEEDYTKDVTVVLDMTSIQKDLKIKFVNQKTGKLVANVPFSVNVTDPDGKTAVWSDDDMDGIIYEKGIAPGNYKVQMIALEGDKYKEYTLSLESRKVEVRKDIEYKKVDVGNEVKKESQINAKKEDTMKKDTQVESALKDTVNWVESTSTANTFTEIPKSSVPDPTTLALGRSFVRTAFTASVDPASRTVAVGESFNVQAVCSGAVLTSVTWASSNPAVATVDAAGRVTAVGKGTAVISYNATVSSGDAITTTSAGCSVTVNENLGKGILTADNASPMAAVGATVTFKVVPSNFTPGKELVYGYVSNRPDIAGVSVDAEGKVTVNGVAAGDAVLTITANYKEGGTADTQAVITVNVKVTANKGISLDRTSATVYIGTPVTINATVANAVTQAAVTAVSSDGNIATATVNGRAVTISGVNPGSATITVKYSENGEEVSAACTVNVKPNPRDDRSTKLKDTSGRQLYVEDNGSYREAVHADYYNYSKFFIKGELKYTGWQTLDGKVYFFDAAGNKVTGEQVIQGAKYNFASDGSLVTGSGTMGIDVSKWNGSIDWNAVKNSGVSYAIIRCGYRGSSQGALIEDPKYYNNIKGATAAGLKVGVYFFSQAVDEVEAVEEASMVLEMVKNYKISYPIFLDVETSGGRGDRIDKNTRTAVCKAFCKTIQDAGYTAGVYSNKSWLTSKLDAQSLSAYKIWLAQYASKPTYTGRYDLWQYRSTGRVSGISGNVDLNLSYLGY